MFGLSFEKLFVVLVFAAIVVGPSRLPGYASRLADTLRALRSFVDASRHHAETDLGFSLAGAERTLSELRQYTPRRLVQDALRTDGSREEGADAAAVATAPDRDIADGAAVPSPAPALPDEGDAAAAPATPPLRLANASATGRGARYAVSGSAAHPRRILLAPPVDDASDVEDGVQPGVAERGAAAERVDL